MVFLTGGTGLLGQYILQKLFEQGYKIRALCRNIDKVPTELRQKAEWVQGDLHDIPALGDYLEGCAYIIHGAGKVSYQTSDKKELYKTNVEGTANLVNVALDFPIRKFLHISSIAALGRIKDSLHIDESAQWQETELNTYYAKTKYLGELEVWRGVAEGLPALIVQPSIVLGAGDWYESSTQIFNYVWREKGFYPKGQLSYVDVRDVAEAITHLLPTEIEAERYILSAGEASYIDLFTEIAQRFQKRPPNRIMTPFLGAVAWRWYYFKSLIFGGKPLVSKETVMLGKNDYSYSNKKVCQTLNFKFRTLSETLDWACQENLQKNIVVPTHITKNVI